MRRHSSEDARSARGTVEFRAAERIQTILRGAVMQ
jgi:hypothetical protein